MPEKVIYTDGHDVTVTDSTLQVKKHEYYLNGVTKCGLMTIRPRRAPGFVLLLLGVVLIVVGLARLIDPAVIPDVALGDTVASANMIAVWSGAALALIGLLIVGLGRERYAVRIATAEGEKDAVVSTRKDYVNQIVDAINQAISFVRTNTSVPPYDVRRADI